LKTYKLAYHISGFQGFLTPTKFRFLNWGWTALLSIPKVARATRV